MYFNQNLQIGVYVISIILVFLTILVGVLFLLLGSYCKLSAIGMVLNFWMSIVLFYGAKTRDTTHLLIWLLASIMQSAGSFIAMCYFAYQAHELKLLNIEYYSNLTKDYEEEQYSMKMRSNYILYSVIFGIVPILFASMAIFVIRFYIIAASQDMTDSNISGTKLFS